MTTLYRVQGDHGPMARIRLRLTDREGTPIDTGPATLHVGGLFDGPLTHEGDGWWYHDPAEDALSRAGRFAVDARIAGVSLPAQAPIELVVRRQADPPK